MEIDTGWKVAKKESHRLEVHSEVGEDGRHWWSASVKWDGCIDLHRAYNIPFGTPDRDKDHMAFTSDLHLCDLDELIERLQLLRAMAKQHFGEDWPR